MQLSPDDLIAILLSLKIATAATLFSLPLGLAVAWLLARGNFPGKALLDALVHMPLVMPPVVTGLLLLILFGKRGPIGAFLQNTFGFSFAFRWTGAALASAVMAFPLMVRPMRLTLEAIDPRLERAAASLGAGPIATFFLVTLPLAAPGILVGAILAFAKSLGEFGATITFVSNIPGETRTIAAAIWSATQVPDGEGRALRLALVSASIAIAALLVSEGLTRLARRNLPR